MDRFLYIKTCAPVRYVVTFLSMGLLYLASLKTLLTPKRIYNLMRKVPKYELFRKGVNFIAANL